jgi:hypothetical protein
MGCYWLDDYLALDGRVAPSCLLQTCATCRGGGTLMGPSWLGGAEREMWAVLHIWIILCHLPYNGGKSRRFSVRVAEKCWTLLCRLGRHFTGCRHWPPDFHSHVGASHIRKTAPSMAAVADRTDWLARPDGRPPHRGDVPTNHRVGSQRWLQIKEATKTRIEQDRTLGRLVIDWWSWSSVGEEFGLSCWGVKTFQETEPSDSRCKGKRARKLSSPTCCLYFSGKRSSVAKE